MSLSKYFPLLLPLLLGACTVYHAPAPELASVPPEEGPVCSTAPASGEDAEIVGEMADLSDLLEEIPEVVASGELKTLGFSTQVGAFSSMDNAARLEESLRANGIDAYSFRHESGLYKVRFGDHTTYEGARGEAERLRAQGLIGEFFIVSPDQYAATRTPRDAGGDRAAVREALVRTVRRFLGVKYQWGGTSPERGFDCSGLTMVCYRLNGLKLPRVSYNQAKAGRAVPKDKLRKGDLVFFATHGGKRVSHVGMYIGDGKFIHAPRKGKDVRVADLSNSYWRRRYVVGRSYL